MSITSKLTIAALLLSLGTVTQAEQRCGWLSNPAMGKWDLYDADGAWQLMFLGGDGKRAEGMENIPDLTAGEYVYTFATKGYGCACMNVDTDEASVTKIYSVKQLPLSRCRNDPKIQDFPVLDK